MGCQSSKVKEGQSFLEHENINIALVNRKPNPVTALDLGKTTVTGSTKVDCRISNNLSIQENVRGSYLTSEQSLRDAYPYKNQEMYPKAKDSTPPQKGYESSLTKEYGSQFMIPNASHCDPYITTQTHSLNSPCLEVPRKLTYHYSCYSLDPAVQGASTKVTNIMLYDNDDYCYSPRQLKRKTSSLTWNPLSHNLHLKNAGDTVPIDDQQNQNVALHKDAKAKEPRKSSSSNGRHKSSCLDEPLKDFPEAYPVALSVKYDSATGEPGRISVAEQYITESVLSPDCCKKFEEAGLLPLRLPVKRLSVGLDDKNLPAFLSSCSSLEKDHSTMISSSPQNVPDFAEIILESSVVVGFLGQMLLLPWNDDDEDITNSCWMGSWPSPIHEFLKKYSGNRMLCVETKTSIATLTDSNSCSESSFPKLQWGKSKTKDDQKSSMIPHLYNSVPWQCAARVRPLEAGELSKTSSVMLYNMRKQRDLEGKSSMIFENARIDDTVAWESMIEKSSGSSSSSSFSTCSDFTSSSRTDSLCSSRENKSRRESIREPHLKLNGGKKVALGNGKMNSFGKELFYTKEAASSTGLNSSVFQNNSFLKSFSQHCVSASRIRPISTPSQQLNDQGKEFEHSKRDGGALAVWRQSRPVFYPKIHCNVPREPLYDKQHPSVLCRINLIFLPNQVLSKNLADHDALPEIHSNQFIEGWSLRDGRFTDPDGYIALSRKQQKKFFAWKRITDLKLTGDKSPCIIKKCLDSRLIRQGFVGDCSFLSSLAVLVQYENTHHIPIVSSIMHPQKQHAENQYMYPVLNPSGFYVCRIFFNGVARKVILDDYIPVRQDDKVLSAHSAEKTEFWVSLLEKCFVKMMGGSYFIQGSNPGTDMYHLTGWIPETIPFHSDVQSGSPENCRAVVTGGYEIASMIIGSEWDSAWDQLYDGLKTGKCVACLGTSEIVDSAPSGLNYPEGVSRSSGIVARHAYSILGCRNISGKKLLYIKNPWGCIRWRGDFSPYDKKNWTDWLQKQLDYNREQAADVDDGYFWIEWSDVVKWFSHLYICWNPACFPFQKVVHSKWEYTQHGVCSLLADDSHVIAFNPQFLLSLHPQPNVENSLYEVWIFLSRHVRERKHDLSQRYLAIHVYTGCQRLCCPSPPIKQGIYSNGECTLVKLLLDFSDPCRSSTKPIEKELFPSSVPIPTLSSFGTNSASPLFHDKQYVLVVSQYSQKENFNFTIKTYSAIPATITPLPPLIPDHSHVTRLYLEGSWSEATAGGCSNHLWSYLKNPHIRLSLPQTYNVIVFLRCSQDYSINLRLIEGCYPTPRLIRSCKALSSGSYRSGCCVIQQTLHAGDFTLITSTFNPGEIGDFQLVLFVFDASPGAPNPSHIPSEKITFKLVPYPYAIPPPPEFFYKKFFVYERPSKNVSFSMFGRIFRILPDRTSTSHFFDIALQLYVKRGTESCIYPSMVLYRSTTTVSSSSNVPLPSELEVVCRSDLEGGHFNPPRTFSSAANEFYNTMNVNTMTVARLSVSSLPYILIIKPAVLKKYDKHSSPCLVFLDSMKSSQSIHKSQIPQEFTLHVISDISLFISF